MTKEIDDLIVSLARRARAARRKLRKVEAYYRDRGPDIELAAERDMFRAECTALAREIRDKDGALADARRERDEARAKLAEAREENERLAREQAATRSSERLSSQAMQAERDEALAARDRAREERNEAYEKLGQAESKAEEAHARAEACDEEIRRLRCVIVEALGINTADGASTLALVEQAARLLVSKNAQVPASKVEQKKAISSRVPVYLTPEIRTALRDKIVEGNTVRDACRAVGVLVPTFYWWRKVGRAADSAPLYREFYTTMRDAIAERDRRLRTSV
jgi:hypothetical protein